MVPFIADKSKWAYPKDVMYFDQWPVRQISLLFAGKALEQPAYLELWRKLNPDPTCRRRFATSASGSRFYGCATSIKPLPEARESQLPCARHTRPRGM